MSLLEKINKSQFTPLSVFFIVVFGLLTFVNMLGNSFVWDDEEMVVNNFPFFKIENIPHLFTQATFFSGGSELSGWFYRPLVMLSFLLIFVIFGNSSFWFHFVQLIFHLANAVLLFFVFVAVFSRIDKELTKIIALFLSLVFVVHPAHVESVSYIASLAEPLYTFFLLSLFLLLLKGEKTELSPRWGMVILSLFALALLAKEGSIVFLPLSVSYLLLFQQKRRVGFWLKYLFLGLAVYLFLRIGLFGIQLQRPNFLSPIAQAGFQERVLTAFYSFFVFLRTFFFPKELSISQHFLITNLSDWRFWAGFASVMIVLFFFIYFVRHRATERENKVAIFFLGWFLAFVFLVLNILFPLDMTFAERWLYFSMIGLLGLLGVILLKCQGIIKRYFLVFGLIGLVVVVLLSLRTINRNADWKDGYTLYTHDIKLTQGSFDLENNLGVELFRKGDIENAKAHFEKSIKLQPNWAISLNNLGAVYERGSNFEKAKFYYEKAIEKGDYYLAYENLAGLLARELPSEESLEFLKRAVLKFPQSPKINIAAAILYARARRQDEALRFAARARQLDSSFQTQVLYEAILKNKPIELNKD